MKRYFPFFQWIRHYKKSYLQGDLSAGITVGVMLIPQGMAYAMLAGLPPIYGLYAATLPLVVYALLGTSRQLAVGPVAMVALLTASGLGQFATIGTEHFIELAISLAFLVGLIQFSMGLFRLGFLVNFLSHPVIAGFTSAAAIIIGISQLKHLLGIPIPRGHLYETLVHLFQALEKVNLPTFLLGSVAIAFLWLLKKRHRKFPAPIVAVVAGILSTYLFDLSALGVSIIGNVPSGLPMPALPNLQLDTLQLLLPTALTIAFVSFMESIAIAKAIQKKHQDYSIDNNQELIGLGLANVFGAFFKAFPVTGGFSRTAVNDQAGAKTGLAAIISALLIVLSLLFFTSNFYYLPTAILSAIILVAVIGLIDVEEARHLWQTDRRDFSLFIVTALGTLLLGIEQGILLGAGLYLV
ncbi:MAG: sulfate permease [Bacteroidota bacterium]